MRQIRYSGLGFFNKLPCHQSIVCNDLAWDLSQNVTMHYGISSPCTVVGQRNCGKYCDAVRLVTFEQRLSPACTIGALKPYDRGVFLNKGRLCVTV